MLVGLAMDAQAVTAFPQAMALIFWLTFGLGVGAMHYLSLSWNARLFARGGAFFLALGVQIARFALIASVLAIIAIQVGATALLLTGAGVIAARAVFVRKAVQA